MVGVRRPFAVLLFVAALTGAVCLSAPCARAAQSGPSCGTQLMTSGNVAIRILFAKNGAVQRYLVEAGQDNVEAVNDFRGMLQNRYGPAEVNAPPLRIVSFKKGSGGGMMLPDKAVDSCGRTLSFN